MAKAKEEIKVSLTKEEIEILIDVCLQDLKDTTDLLHNKFVNKELLEDYRDKVANLRSKLIDTL